MNITGILVGMDPEMFLTKNIKGSDVFFSAEMVVKGTKDEPAWIDDTKQRGILLDNVSIEYVGMPHGDKASFVQENELMVKYIETAMSTFGLKISKDSVAEFMPHFLATDNAMAFGCSPSFNAKTGKVNKMPDAKMSEKRSCGGHVHVSINDYVMSFDDCIELTKIMDLNLGVPSVLLSKDRQRRKLFYGKAGEFRHQRERYLEYRSLDNFWIFDKKYMEWVFDQTELSVMQFASGVRIKNSNYGKICNIINNYDNEGAIELIKLNNIKTI